MSFLVLVDHLHDRLVDLGQPAVGHHGRILTLELVVGGERIEVVEQPTGLVLLDVESREALSRRWWCPASTTLAGCGWSHRPVGDDVQLVDVEAEAVEPGDPLFDAHISSVVKSSTVELGPQSVVPALESFDELVRVDLVAHEAAGLEIQRLGEQVAGRRVEIVGALTVAELLVQLSGLGVDQVRRELAGRASEQRVEREQSPQKKPDRCNLVSSTTSASTSKGNVSGRTPREKISR